MKVAILNNDFRVYWKGRLLFLHDFLAAQGIELYAIELFGKGSPYDFDSIDKSHDWWDCAFPDESATDLDKYTIKRELYSRLNALQPDVVIGPSIVFFAGALGLAWSKKHQKKFIMFDDAKPQQVKRNFVVQTVKDIITSQVDGFWLPSPLYDSFYKKYADKNKLIFYGFNCIDNQFFKPKMPKSFNTNTIVCVARLVPIKNIERLIKAWAKIEIEHTNITLNIIGNGPMEKILKRLKNDLKLSTVNFIDAVDNEKLTDYFNDTDAFILPSLSETWGLVVNEAMAAGLPVLLSDSINSAADLLQEGVNGFGFDPFDIDTIIAAIGKYIKLDNAEKIAMGQKSQEIIDSLSYEKMGTALFSALEQIQFSEFKKSNIITSAIVNSWHGRYNTAGWYKL